MLDGARVLVIEMIIEPALATSSPNSAILMDINMMTMCTGRERTVDEFKSVFTQASLVLRKEFKTPSPYSILEAVAA
jgi:O-methyltransferase domain